MSTNQISIWPRNESNADQEELADMGAYTFQVWAQEAGKPPYDSDSFKTRKEAFAYARGLAEDLGWAEGTYDLSVDE
jgi:hypothetical protein